DEQQPIKMPHLRNAYQRLGFERAPGAIAVDGFGFSHDGVQANIFNFLGLPTLGELTKDPVATLNVAAFVMSFDTGTAPAVGLSVTLNADNIDDGRLDLWSTLAHQAAAGNIDLIAKGRFAGAVRGFLYQPDVMRYVADTRTMIPVSWDQILAR